jgi:hypothetical protein
MKCCSKCGEVKELSEFYKRKDTKDGYRHDCKECKNKSSRAWERNNREYHNLLKRQWNLKNKDKKRRNSKKLYEQKKEARLKQIAEWKANNKDKVNAMWMAREARKKNSIPDFVKGCTEEKRRIDNIYALSEIMTKATGIRHHVDHMWPISDGGPHWSGNLQIIPAHDNLCKNATVIPEIKQTIQAMLDSNQDIAHTRA